MKEGTVGKFKEDGELEVGSIVGESRLSMVTEVQEKGVWVKCFRILGGRSSFLRNDRQVEVLTLKEARQRFYHLYYFLETDEEREEKFRKCYNEVVGHQHLEGQVRLL